MGSEIDLNNLTQIAQTGGAGLQVAILWGIIKIVKSLSKLGERVNGLEVDNAYARGLRDAHYGGVRPIRGNAVTGNGKK